MNWEGFPLIVLGTTDMDRKFHLLGLCLVTSETKEDYTFMFESVNIGLDKINVDDRLEPSVIVADAAQSIKNAALQVFAETIKIRMCYFHVVKNLKTLLKGKAYIDQDVTYPEAKILAKSVSQVTEAVSFSDR